jgi:thiamine biosynthesis lipoprotein
VSDISRDAVKAVFTHSESHPVPLSEKKPMMGGSASLTILGGGSEMLAECWSFVGELEKLWSRFLDDSDVTRLNWAEGKSIDVDPRTALLVSQMKDGYARTRGLFDPTLLPDVMAAGYSASRVDPKRISTLPASATSPGRIDLATVSANVVTLPKGTTIDPGGIGKGLAADLVCDFALGLGAWGIMAEIAGDVRVSGEAPDGVAWRIGVEDPFNTGSHTDVVRVPNGGVVTSSQRKRRLGDKGEKHHLINPSTRDSAQTDVQTVTIIAGTAATAETLTKPGFLQATPDFLSWVVTQGAAGLVIDINGEHHESSNWSLYR